MTNLDDTNPVPVQRAYLKQVNVSPRLETFYTPLPFSSHLIVFDFWSSYFAPNPGQGSGQIEGFVSGVSDYLYKMGYTGHQDGELHTVSFSGGWVGVMRKMIVYSSGRARAAIFFKAIDNLYYVSLRVIYPQPISILKIIWFLLTCLLLAMSLRTFEVASMSWFTPGVEQIWRIFFYQSLDAFNRGTTLMYMFYIVIGLGFFRGFMGLWRLGDFWAFLRQDFDELYRDDLASIGGAAYMAIIDTADQLSLKSVDPPPGAIPPPNFAAPRESTRVRRI